MAIEPGQGALIDITIKTLDGQNRTFNVSENLNVRQFKENISNSIEIPAENQRLIFQGRVMQDEKVLKDYDIHGKVIHLVQRAPPTTISGASNTSPTTTSTPTPGRTHVPLDGNLFDVQIHLGRVQNTPNTREARARVRQADFNLRLVNDILNQLEQQRLGSTSDGNAAQVTSELPRPRSTAESVTTTTTDNQSADSMDTSSPPEADRTSRAESRDQAGQQPRSSSEPRGSLIGDQQVGLMATDLANFLDQVLTTNDRVTSHIRLYRDLLRNEVTYPASSREAQDAQEVASRTTEIFHALGHMLHSLSDVVVDMATDVPRQAVAIPPVPFPIHGTTSMAIPIHMNVRARQNNNGQRQRPGQPTSAATSTTGSTSTVPTPSTTASLSSPSGGVVGASGTTATSNNATSTSNTGSSLGSFQIPPVSLNLPSNVTTTGDPTVMVEVFPAGVTVHDIRAMVTQEGIEDDSDSSTDSVDNADGSRTNITITSTTIEHPVQLSTATTTSSSTIPSTAVPASEPQPSASIPRTTNAGPFTTTTSSSSAFIFGPTASVSFREMPNFGIGQMPNVPGLPPGMLQNILGSILNSHGVRPDQPVQVNVVQQLNAAGVPTTRFPQPTQQQPPQQNIQDLPVDDDRVVPRSVQDNLRQQQSTNLHYPWMPMSTRVDATLQNPLAADISTATHTNTATNTISTTAPSMTTSAASNSTSVSTSAFPLTFNLSNLVPQSINIGTSTDPSIGTNSQSTNTVRPQFHFHRGSAGQARPQLHARPQVPGPLRPGLVSRGYVDPYLPCSSTHYMSQTAVSAFNAMQTHTRGQQQPQQQVPNLSAMVSGMVGEIFEQVGQAAVSSGARTTSTSTSSITPSLDTSAAATAGIGAQRPPPPLNPMEMFAHLIGGNVNSSQAGAPPFDVGTIFSNIMQGTSTPPATTTTTTTTRETSAAAWTLADLFTRVRPANEDNAGEENVVTALLEAVAPQIGLTDLFSLVLGNTRVLNQLRGTLREFVRRQVARYGSVDHVVKAALNDIYPEIEYLQSLVEVREGVDMAQSLRGCLQVHLTTIFTAINSDSAGPQGDFGKHLYSMWLKMLADSIGLCIYCIRNGQIGFSSLVQNYMPRMTQDMSPVTTAWMTTTLEDTLVSFYYNHPVPESEIMHYVVSRSESPSISSVREIYRSDETPTYTAVADVTLGSLSGTSSPGPMDIKESPSSQPPRAKVPRTLPDEDTEIFEDAQESFSSRPVLRSRPNTISTRANHTEGTVGGSRDMRNGRNPDDWQSVVPQDWIPVISRDIVRQQDQRPQPPLSDAYLQGLPAKRRRMMALEHAGEMGNMPLYLPASLTRAARAADVEPISSEENMAQEAADNLDLQTELEREMTRVLATRITTDQDFGSERFPNAKEYFHKSSRR